MIRTCLITIVLVFVFCGIGAVPAHSFDECSTDVAAGGHWPNPRNTDNFGTQKWEFDWRVLPVGGLEISNVRYTGDLSQPKKLVIKRGSLPFLPVHYPESPPTCDGNSPQLPRLTSTQGTTHGFNDQVGTAVNSIEPLCCAHVPTTVCNVPERAMACVPALRPVENCSNVCPGVCQGTQIDVSLPIEDGVGETVSGAADADIVLTVQFRYGGYQFIQRWRFRDDGTLLPSLRAGGVHDCQWHNHQIYWRLNFQLADAPNESVQECAAGGCADLGMTGWRPVTSCGVGATRAVSWRIMDAAAAGRAVVVERGPNDGDPFTFCEGTSTECGAGRCVNTHDFCALPAAEPYEGLVFNNCNDHLADAVGTSSDLAFWYFAQVEHHSPCDFLPMCDPDIGTVAFGPTIRLVGSW